MDDWSADARGVLDDARGADDPSRADRARIDRKMAARLGAAALVTSGVVASSAPAGATAVLGAGLGLKVAVALVAVVAATGGGFAAWHGLRAHAATARAPHATPMRVHVEISPRIANRVEAPSAPASAPVVATEQPATAAPVIGAAPAAGAASELHVRHALSAHAAPAVVAPAPVDPLNEENALLDDARRALHAHDPSVALAALDRYGARYPGGRLAEENGALRVMALCALHRGADARTARTAFDRAWPGSAYATRFDAACTELDPPR